MKPQRWREGRFLWRLQTSWIGLSTSARLADKGAVPVTIGDLVLRTETAGAYVAMLIRYNYHLLESLEV